MTEPGEAKSSPLFSFLKFFISTLQNHSLRAHTRREEAWSARQKTFIYNPAGGLARIVNVLCVGIALRTIRYSVSRRFPSHYLTYFLLNSAVDCLFALSAKTHTMERQVGVGLFFFFSFFLGGLKPFSSASRSAANL